MAARTSKTLWTVFTGIAAGAGCADHGGINSQEIRQRVLRVAVPQDFPPFGSAGTDLQPQGYDTIWRYLADKMKNLLQLVPVTSANWVSYLQTNEVDLVISSLGVIRSVKRPSPSAAPMRRSSWGFCPKDAGSWRTWRSSDGKIVGAYARRGGGYER